MDGKTPRSMTMDFGGTTDGDSELKIFLERKYLIIQNLLNI